ESSVVIEEHTLKSLALDGEGRNAVGSIMGTNVSERLISRVPKSKDSQEESQE
ncbi:hypothetical protein STEG23_036824, partial [Scotinomys teguina]